MSASDELTSDLALLPFYCKTNNKELNKTTTKNTSGGISSQCAMRIDLHDAKPSPFAYPMRAVA